MRFALAALSAAALSGTAAHAEKHLFILAGHADGDGIDNALPPARPATMWSPNSYCRSHNFAEAESLRNVGRDDVTGADDSGGYCAPFIAIECSR